MATRTSYSEFCQKLSEDICERYKLILGYDDFAVYQDRNTLKYYYLEGGENDASDFYEVELIATLSYSVINDLKIKGADAGIIMAQLFDCDVCGEHISDKQIEYLWFKEKREVKK